MAGSLASSPAQCASALRGFSLRLDLLEREFFQFFYQNIRAFRPNRQNIAVFLKRAR